MPPPENPKTGPGRLKPDMALIPASALVHLAHAMMDGRDRYGAYNYRQTRVSMMVYLSPILRHYAAYLDGEDYDPKTKVHHLAYVMSNCAIILDGIETKHMADDRPAKGVAGEMVRRFVEQGHLMPSPSLVPETPRLSRGVLLKSKLVCLAMERGSRHSKCTLCDTLKTWGDSDEQPAHEHDSKCLLWEDPGDQQQQRQG